MKFRIWLLFLWYHAGTVAGQTPPPSPKVVGYCMHLPTIIAGYVETPPPITVGVFGKVVFTWIGQTLRVQCQSGTEMAGSAYITCQHNSSWSQPGRCVPVMPKYCPENIQVPNGVVTPGSNFVGSVRRFYCSYGFTMAIQGNINGWLICDRDGQWKTTDVCLESQNVSSSASVFTSSSARFPLNSLPPASSTTKVTTRATTAARQLPPLGTVARAATNCQTEPTIENGQVSSGLTATGTVRQFQCNEGFAFQSSVDDESSILPLVECNSEGQWKFNGACSPIKLPDSSFERKQKQILEYYTNDYYY